MSVTTLAPKSPSDVSRRPYYHYKPSDISWLGKIPTHWDTVRFKYLARLAYGDPLPADSREAGDAPVYGSNGIVGRHSQANTAAPVLIVGRKGSFGKVNYSTVPSFAIDTTFFIDPRWTRLNIRWLFYALQLLGLDTVSRDSTVPGLSREAVYDQWLPSLDLSEQQAIATFLDRETAKIDALIAKKEHLIALLQEKRTALISSAVTRGLDPDAPMRDSGIAWLGQVPAHWEVMRLKFAARMESGHTPTRTVAAYWENCTIPWVTLNDLSYLKDHDYIYETLNQISEIGIANSSARLLPAGTVILSRDATVGRCSILGRPMTTSQHFVDWICHDFLMPKYLLYVFRGPMQQEFERLSMGATISTLGMPDVNTFQVPLPPIDEQQQIVDYVDRKVRALDRLLIKVREHIDRLREYRTALISAAVTGKIDVRGEAG